MTRRAFDNAIAVTIAMGGSTNSVLHLIAMAHSVDMELTLADFQAVSDRVPILADLKPSGRYVIEDLHRCGGTPGVMKLLLEAGLLDGDCVTVTGKTLAENLETLPPLASGQAVIRAVDDPIKPTGHLQVMRGNLAPGGAVAKLTGREGDRFEGPARVFESEEEMLAALQRTEIQAGDVVVIRYEGPKGGPGMPEMLTPTSAIVGAGLGRRCGAPHGWAVLGRLARLHHRAHRPGGTGRRPDCPGAERRPDPHRCDFPFHRPRRRRERARRATRGLGDAAVQGATRHPAQVHQERSRRLPRLRDGRLGRDVPRQARRSSVDMERVEVRQWVGLMRNTARHAEGVLGDGDPPRARNRHPSDPSGPPRVATSDGGGGESNPDPLWRPDDEPYVSLRHHAT